MADMIVCPLCGTENLPNQKVCQRCQTPLSNDVSFKPGQAPVHKDTGELEAVLPQWLRDARESAKQTEPPKEETPAPSKDETSASSMDFLAGLQSQAGDDDEEDVPDWLASITGTSAPKPKAEEPETGGVRWVETGKEDDFAQTPSSSEEEVPSWLAGIQSPQFGAEEKDELTDWFRESGGGEQSFQPPIQQSQPSAFEPSSFPADSSNDTPDWLKQMQAGADQEPEPSASSSASSDWFSQPQADFESAPQTPAAEPFLPTDTPDWVKQMQADAGTSEPEPSSTEAFNLPSDTPDWLNQLQTDASDTELAQSAEPFNLPTDTPDWLSQLQTDAGASEPAQSAEPASFSAETPDWLNSLGGEPTPFVEPAPAESEPVESIGEVPSWLAPDQDATKKTDSKPRWLQSEEEKEIAAGTPAWLASNEKTLVPDEGQGTDDVLSNLPDWLKSAAPESSIFDEPVQTSSAPKIEEPKPETNTPFETTPAFSEDALRAEAGLFTEMPDWLSSAMEDSSSTPVVPEPMTGSDALAPDVLPSWVEAMRPTDQGMANIVALSSDQTLESRGALAGLSGVLPAGVGYNPTSKPKAYSIKLNASVEQLKHAEILEQILAAETAPETLATERTLGASRGLRWTLAAILLLIVFATLGLRTRFFSMPIGVPSELSYAVAVAQTIPANAPVLVAVDYEPSRAAEMEAAAAPLFDNLLLLKQPRLTFISSSEAGAVLSERFMAGPLAVHNYQNGVTYLNLGYLSGGQMGVRAFSQNPAFAAPNDIASQPAWTLPPLQGVTALNQFAMIILLTDNAEAARTWIEQTQSARGAVPIVVVSSAQAAPMIQPYYASGQVAGMVSGLYGGAIFEKQYNNGRPGMAREYWDPYSIGMLFAMMLVLGGGFVNLALGLRDRAAMSEAN